MVGRNDAGREGMILDLDDRVVVIVGEREPIADRGILHARDRTRLA